ncbi:MAG: metal-dependent transcriptional regulator [Sphaerochaetaceae bacterium]|jgi:Mn-dependent DtxR family transcriptional regulator|nr:metal-dependent transcriptional regulator [Sphaerochaetaceae bacterium]MDD3942894.1 metal-dependent transcriptional regulator [Sphaerochaetaceae bacterium]MDX9939312.1 metal-dependent transcriptional regulator [Sphaerochaetaceae bacterium]
MRESGEDYLEAVLALEQEHGTVRLTDVALRLGVTKPSVSRAMKILQADGFIHQENYGTIELTAKGRLKASQVYTRHKTLTTFLGEVLGLDAETAETDACRMEHILSAETMERLSAFVEEHKAQE